MDISSIQKSYGFYAPIYDLVFGKIFEHGRKEAVRRATDAGAARVLEIGVGTGLSIPFYASNVKVVGIDVSAKMLEKANRRFPADRYPQVEDYMEMDAQHLEFSDNSFDSVVAMYVASVVPDPTKMMDEMVRVCTPGGKIIVLNHFASEKGLFRIVEKGLAPLSDRLGFHPDFSLQVFLEKTDIEVKEIARVNLGGYWKLIEFTNRSANGNGQTSGAADLGDFAPQQS